MKYFLRVLFLLFFFISNAQNNNISVEAELFPEEKTITIKQNIVYHNTSNDTLKKIILRNWANSYKNDSTPLAKRLLSDNRTSFYFSEKRERGYSEIHQIKLQQKSTDWVIKPNLKDLVFLPLPSTLKPKDSIDIQIEYTVKIPKKKFTGSGVNHVDFFLKDWIITPSIYHKGWILDKHQNLDYQYHLPTNYNISIKTPVGINIYSNLKQSKKTENQKVIHTLKDTNIVNPELNITFLKTYLEVKTPTNHIFTDFINPDLEIDFQKEKIHEMLIFLQKNIGVLKQKNLLVDFNSYKQDPIYELKYFPNFLHPYTTKFKWEVEFFKAFANTYISQITIQNQNKEYWFAKGLEVYILAKYVDEFYPNSKLVGRISEIWGLNSLHISKQNFNSKFSIVHQITARENLDQKLTTPLAQLNNYNRKVVSPYKAGIGFMFLEKYLEPGVLDQCIQDFIAKNIHKPSKPQDFLNLLQSKTSKNIDWFFTEWIDSNKKIDHKIVNVDFNKDSVLVTIKNNRSIKTPISIYGLQKDSIVHQEWIDGFSGSKTIGIKNKNIDKIVLNYENIYPEINYTNNWFHQKKKLIQRPLKIKILKDLNNPNTHQVFLRPEANFNLYDGVLLGLSVQNEGFLNKNFHYMLKPSYGVKSNSLNGSFKLNYTLFPEKTKIYNTTIGISGNHYQYDRNLNYRTLSPFASISFKQKNFRALGTNSISTHYSWIDRDIAPGTEVNDEDKYNMFRVSYNFNKNQLIHNYRIHLNTEIATNFTKLNTEFKYRHLTNRKRAIEFRFFGGVFLRNQTTSDYFSYNQHTPNDYLFELPYLGRSETDGIYSQQYFQSQGGFVSQNNPGYANQWLTSINTSVGLYKWVEIFNNVSLLKNKNEASHFDYETGIRLNFIPNILEFYLPAYNKEGFVTKQGDYLRNIRFVLTLKSGPILSFLRQQIF